jgi:uncharacterized protein DUF2855
MSETTQYLVNKSDFADLRVVKAPLPSLQKGEALIRMGRVAFTANNISYALAGESLGYWKFFPPVSDQNTYGLIPVWGYGEVEAENDSGLDVGEGVFGYWPMASHWIVQPGSMKPHRFIDSAEHRASLPGIYNNYRRVAKEEMADGEFADRQSLLFPLVGTAFGIFDWLQTEGRGQATQIILTSASSKTALGLAFLAKNNSDIKVIGLTSAGNLEATTQIGFYHQVFSYEDLEKTIQAPTIIVDMAGNGALSAKLHQHLGDTMLREARVGATHADKVFAVDGIIKERSFFFFLPSHAAKRQPETDGAFLKDMLAFSGEFARRSGDWLEVVDGETTELYEKVRTGSIMPNQGAILSLS